MTPAQTAAAEYTRRRAWLAAQVTAGELAADSAEARLRPWLHLAAIAGAEIPAVYEDTIYLFPWDLAGQPARIPLALTLTLADRTAALTALARARDAAVAASERDPRKLDHARALDRLAWHLLAPPMGATSKDAA